MDDNGGFDSVQWDRDREGQAPEESTSASGFPAQSSLTDRSVSRGRNGSTGSEPQAGENADAVDLAGIGPEGILECTVDTPLKENDGTKDAYVSYLISTHVGCQPSPHTSLMLCRPTSRPFREPNSPYVDVSQTSSTYAMPYIETFQPAPYLHFRRRTTWHMFEEIDSATTLRSGERGLSTVLSTDVPCILS